MIARARDAGLAGVVCIGASVEQARASRRLAAAHPRFLRFTAGIHPHDAGSATDADMGVIDEILRDGAVAVGECGLDYHYDHAPRAQQRAVFEAQLDLARRRALPAVVHTRDAEADTAAMVGGDAGSGVRGVLHCFTGSAALARTALDAGWYVSFSGIVTFRNWANDDVIRLVPADRLLVESDAPYLAPVPHRGRRNEPAWLGATLARIAAVRGEAAASLAVAVGDNTRALFSLDVAPARSF